MDETLKGNTESMQSFDNNREKQSINSSYTKRVDFRRCSYASKYSTNSQRIFKEINLTENKKSENLKQIGVSSSMYLHIYNCIIETPTKGVCQTVHKSYSTTSNQPSSRKIKNSGSETIDNRI